MFTECVDAIEELPEDVLLLQEVQRDLRQRGAKLSSRARRPAQFPNLQQYIQCNAQRVHALTLFYAGYLQVSTNSIEEFLIPLGKQFDTNFTAQRFCKVYTFIDIVHSSSSSSSAKENSHDVQCMYKPYGGRTHIIDRWTKHSGLTSGGTRV